MKLKLISHKKELSLVKELIVDKFATSDDILFYMFLHSKFDNSLIFNWSYKKLQDITGLSHNKVKKHIDFLRKNGMISFTKGSRTTKGNYDGQYLGELTTTPTRNSRMQQVSGYNMRIHSVRRFCKMVDVENYKTKRVDVYKSLSFRDFKAYILGFLIDYNQRQQRFIISAKNPKSKRELNLSKGFRRSQPEKVEGNAVGVINSMKGIAKVFNKSEGFVQYWLPIMEAKGIIEKKTKLVPYRVPRRYASSVERCADISCAIRAQGMFYKYISGKFYIVAGTDINVKCMYGNNGANKMLAEKAIFSARSSK